ncbi:uncharacterized protein [Phyllobates terribilis]|uniref:uncharacterized protein n=1 Tax=Phyllobates terribilis TaxID=111132 RepID=UPI003CCAF299
MSRKYVFAAEENYSENSGGNFMLLPNYKREDENTLQENLITLNIYTEDLFYNSPKIEEPSPEQSQGATTSTGIKGKMLQGVKPYSCSECEKGFRNKSGLLTHARIHTGEKPYSCSECGKCFTNKLYLVRHQKIHTGEKLYSCSECEKCFINKSYLVRHYRVHTGEKQYPCSECEKCFINKSDLVRNQRFHTGEKPYSCIECEKCFAVKSDLVNHQRIHTGEKPYSCSKCGKCFLNKSNLVRHEKIHIGEKPYSCSECGKCFTVKSYLVNHQRIHTGEKPEKAYSSLDCGKCFTYESTLIKHKRSHIGEKLFSCSLCGKSSLVESYFIKERTKERNLNHVPNVGNKSNLGLLSHDEIFDVEDFCAAFLHPVIEIGYCNTKICNTKNSPKSHRGNVGLDIKELKKRDARFLQKELVTQEWRSRTRVKYRKCFNS